VEHALARMKYFKILRDYRRAAHTLTDAASGIAHLHNIILAGGTASPDGATPSASYETSLEVGVQVTAPTPVAVCRNSNP
jgi:hypothetical protein